MEESILTPVLSDDGSVTAAPSEEAPATGPSSRTSGNEPAHAPQLTGAAAEDPAQAEFEKTSAPEDSPPPQTPAEQVAPKEEPEAEQTEAAPAPQPDYTVLQARYPGFDPERDGRNPDFTALVDAGIAPDRAYEVVHLDQLLQGAMDYAVRRTMERLVGSSLAAASRPTENGLQSGSTATHSFDPRTLTREQSRDLRDRVYRGEKIYL